MGLFASVVIARAATLPDPVREHVDTLDSTTELCGGWRLFSFARDAVGQRAPVYVARIAERTGAPAIVGQIIDSDFLLVTCHDGQTSWDAIAPTPDDEEFARAGVNGAAAAAAFASWAVAAGLEPELGGLQRACRRQDGAFGGITALHEIVESLGLTPSVEPDGVP